MEVPADTAGVAFLGPLGTYSHQAARQLACGNAVALHAHPSIHAAVQAGIVSSPRAPHSVVVVVPLSNSVQGPVLETFACLGDEATFGPQALKIVDEVDLRIAHSLIVRQASHDPAAQLESLCVVRSHPQALGQCSEFLTKHLPHAAREETPSTAEAVALLQSDKDAAIASELAAELSNAQVLFRGIQNSNSTPSTLMQKTRHASSWQRAIQVMPTSRRCCRPTAPSKGRVMMPYGQCTESVRPLSVCTSCNS